MEAGFYEISSFVLFVILIGVVYFGLNIVVNLHRDLKLKCKTVDTLNKVIDDKDIKITQLKDIIREKNRYIRFKEEEALLCNQLDVTSRLDSKC